MIPRYKPLKRSTERIRQHAPGRAARKKLSPRYLAWIREQPCLCEDMHVCVGIIEAHHVAPGPACQRQARWNDYRAVPLCTLAHDEYHRHREDFERYSIDFERAIRRLHALYEMSTGKKAA